MENVRIPGENRLDRLRLDQPRRIVLAPAPEYVPDLELLDVLVPARRPEPRPRREATGVEDFACVKDLFL